MIYLGFVHKPLIDEVRTQVPRDPVVDSNLRSLQAFTYLYGVVAMLFPLKSFTDEYRRFLVRSRDRTKECKIARVALIVIGLQQRSLFAY